ncbi:1-pyrroline-5-carboxylate dehydrogenase [Saitoella coloradoensis]
MATIASFKLPPTDNEPTKNYAPGSQERTDLFKAIEVLRASLPLPQIPLIINNESIVTDATAEQRMPGETKTVLCEYSQADESHVKKAIEGAVSAQKMWEGMGFHDRAAIFLKAADLIATKYRYEIMAATMLGQGKNAWQAEIDAAAELIDFLRFNCAYAEELYSEQPPKNAKGVWNRIEYRPLEGFTYAISPFNFTAIACNLSCLPALLGNVVIWKPSPLATYSNWIVMRTLLEAGLPAGVVQFIPGDAEMITSHALSHKNFASLHFTGSTAVFRNLWGQMGANVAKGTYRSYPRIVGETGGKNFHLVHPTADVRAAAIQTLRASFEYAGQKCSACSRVYVAQSVWEEFRGHLVEGAKGIKVGRPEEWETVVGPVISQGSFDRLKSAIEEGKKDSELELIAGGEADDSEGYYVHPTIFLSSNPNHAIFSRELFGPVLTAYVYPDSELESTLQLIDSTSEYALTGAIFAQSRHAIKQLTDALRTSAGNFYVNDKCTGAVVGQQPFGGARMSGTNDKAGSKAALGRFVSGRVVKENLSGVAEEKVGYVSNLI